MKHVILCLSLLFLVACKTNNGDIGRYYGTWALDAIEIDGQTDTSWQEPGTWTNWSFQNNIIEIARVDDLQDATKRYGTWKELSDPDVLVLDFTHGDDETQSGTDVYAAPEWVFIDAGITQLSILHASDRNMTLRYTNSEGKTITYYLRKTY